MRNLALTIAALLLLAGGLAAQNNPPGVQARPAADELPVIADLPDPFVFNDGKRVESRDNWEKRRAELKELVQYYQFGHLPPPLPLAKPVEIETRTSAASGAIEKRLVLKIGKDDALRTTLDLTIPSGKGPFPVIIRGDLCWGKLKPEILAEAVKRGYMVAEFDRTEIAPDHKTTRTGLYPLFPEHDPSAMAAWAWGYHRVIDYLVTLEVVDKGKIIVTGHSRGGKATLLAGAMDERIALTNPNNSGCGGAGCYRYQAPKSEDIAVITKNFPHWFCPRFRDFVGKVDRLPIDQHSIKSIVAPRALLTTEALGDLWANPEGTQVTHAAAREVFDFLGARDKIGIYFREGKHDHTFDDFVVLMDFADKVLMGKPVERKFDVMAFPNAPKPWKWSKP